MALYPGSPPGHWRLVDPAGRRPRRAWPKPRRSRSQVRANSLLLGGAAPQRPDPAIGELAEVLYRHMIGAMTVNAAADASSWRTLLLLLARTPEEVRGDGGIARLWATAGGPSLDIVEIDYAEVLREKQGDAATIDQIIAAAIAGPQVQLDDATLQALLWRSSGDPEKFRAAADAARGGDRAGRHRRKDRGVPESASQPDRIPGEDQSRAARWRVEADGRGGRGTSHSTAWSRCSAQRDRPQAMAGTIDVVGAMAERMTRRIGRPLRRRIGDRGARCDRPPRARVSGARAGTRSAAAAARARRERGAGVRAGTGSVLHRAVGQRRGNADVVFRRGLRLVRLRTRADERADASRRRRASQRRSARTHGRLARDRQRQRRCAISIISCCSTCSPSKKIRCDGATWRRRSSAMPTISCGSATSIRRGCSPRRWPSVQPRGRIVQPHAQDRTRTVRPRVDVEARGSATARDQ